MGSTSTTFNMLKIMLAVAFDPTSTPTVKQCENAKIPRKLRISVKFGVGVRIKLR